MKKTIMLLASLLLPSMANAGEVHVAVAANFAIPFAAIAKAYTKATGNQVDVSIGSTGKLYAQIENGAPFQVFLAADTIRPNKLVADGQAVAGTERTYAIGKLALWSPHHDISRGAKTLTAAGISHIAIANPKTAPYGEAAVQTLSKLGLYKKLQLKLVRAENIAQAFQFVASGNAEAGFVAMSQLKGPKAPGGFSWPVPTSLYDAIDQGLCLLKTGASSHAARSLVAFIYSSQADEIISRFGYGVPRL